MEVLLPGPVGSSMFLLHFEPLVDGEHSIEVPCDATGRVDLESLGETLRNEYFYARIMRCFHFAEPVLIRPSKSPKWRHPCRSPRSTSSKVVPKSKSEP